MSRVCGLAIIDVTDGVADGHEESNATSKSVISTTKSLWMILRQLGLCAAVAELSSRHKRCQLELMQTYCPSMHAVLTVQWGC